MNNFWTKHQIGVGSKDPRTVRCADFDGDGKIDLLGTMAGDRLVAWYKNPGTPAIYIPSSAWDRVVIDRNAADPGFGQPAKITRPDQDGQWDVVMPLRGSKQVVWYQNPGAGEDWPKHIIAEGIENPFEVALQDLNNDGYPDVVVTCYGNPGGVYWFENPKNPFTSPWQKHAVTDNMPRANQVAITTLFGDAIGYSWPDLAVIADTTVHQLRCWKNSRRSG